jgi:CO dehydrogenase/acetyl-CoA synthase epsilon subunit
MHEIKHFNNIKTIMINNTLIQRNYHSHSASLGQSHTPFL